MLMSGFDIKMLKNAQDRSIIDSIKKIEDTCFSDAWTLSSIEKEFDNKISNWFAAYDNDDLVGYLLCWCVADECHLLKIAVHESCRRKGIGGMLISHMIDHCYINCCKFIELEVRQSNTDAIRLYEKFGFSKVGERKDYYPDDKETAVMFSKVLNNC